VMIDKFKITDEEMDALLYSRGMKRPPSREQMDLEICAFFLMTAHRWNTKGKNLQEARRIYKSLCEEPGLLDKLRKREMLLGPLTAP